MTATELDAVLSEVADLWLVNRDDWRVEAMRRTWSDRLGHLPADDVVAAVRSIADEGATRLPKCGEVLAVQKRIAGKRAEAGRQFRPHEPARAQTPAELRQASDENRVLAERLLEKYGDRDPMGRYALTFAAYLADAADAVEAGEPRPPWRGTFDDVVAAMNGTQPAPLRQVRG